MCLEFLENNRGENDSEKLENVKENDFRRDFTLQDDSGRDCKTEPTHNFSRYLNIYFYSYRYSCGRFFFSSFDINSPKSNEIVKSHPRAAV